MVLPRDGVIHVINEAGVFGVGEGGEAVEVEDPEDDIESDLAIGCEALDEEGKEVDEFEDNLGCTW